MQLNVRTAVAKPSGPPLSYSQALLEQTPQASRESGGLTLIWPHLARSSDPSLVLSWSHWRATLNATSTKEWILDVQVVT